MMTGMKHYVDLVYNGYFFSQNNVNYEIVFQFDTNDI